MKSKLQSTKKNQKQLKTPSAGESKEHWGKINNMDQALVDALNEAVLKKKPTR